MDSAPENEKKGKARFTKAHKNFPQNKKRGPSVGQVS